MRDQHAADARSQSDYEHYRLECAETGAIPCIDVEGHEWCMDDDSDEIVRCYKCGIGEY